MPVASRKPAKVVLPDFVGRDSDPQAPPPMAFRRVHMRVFPLRADPDALQLLCDRLLNLDPEGGPEPYEPLAGLVLLQALYYEHMTSMLPPYRLAGYSRQHEVLFAVPVVRMALQDDRLLADELAVFVPYIFVNESWSLIGGRDVMGYPKCLASIRMPLPGPYPIRMATPALEPYDPDTELAWYEAVNVSWGTGPTPPQLPPAPARELWPLGPVDLLFAADVMPISSDRMELVHDAVKLARINTVQLKQFRDAQDVSKACFQGLVGAEMHSESGIGNLLPPATVTIQPLDSLPIVQELGLGGHRLTPLWPFWYRHDFSLRNARNLEVRP